MISTQFATIHDLVAATNPAMGNYFIELYGNTYIHQNTQEGSITAYQMDRHAHLHQIEVMCSEMHVSQLSAAPDGRHFVFIAFDPDNPGKGDAYVYYLNTIESSLELAISWPTDSICSMVFFSRNGQYAIYTDGIYQLQVHSLYTDDADKFYIIPSIVEDADWVDIVPHMFGFLFGSDYLLWHMPSGHLAMIDLLPGGQVSHWTLNSSIKIAHPANECWLHNDYLIHVNSQTEAVDIYHINPLEHTMTITSTIPLSKYGLVQCSPGSHSQSVILHYMDSNQRPTSQLVEFSL